MRMRRPALLGLLFLALGSFGWPQMGSAAQIELYGASIRSAGLAGGGWALEDGGASLAVQPAALGLGEGDQFRLHYLGGRVWMDPVSGVTLQEGYEDQAPRVTVQPQVISADFVKGIGPWFRAGVHVNLPLPWLYSHETKDPWVPYSMRWQNRVSRSMATVGFSGRIPIRGVKPEKDPFAGGLWLGAAFSIRPRGVIDVRLDLEGVSNSEGDAVEALLSEVVLAAKYMVRPQLSLLFDFGAVDARLSGLRFGASYFAEATTDISPIRLDVAVLGLGEVNAVFALVERLQADVALGLSDFYDPHQVHLSLALERPRFALTGDVKVALWSQMVPSYGRIADEEGSELLVEFGSDLVEVFPVVSGRYFDETAFRDTVEATLGAEGRIPLPQAKAPGTELRIRGGLRYMQGIVVPNEGPMASIDGDTLSVGLGVGAVIGLNHSNERLGPVKVDWALQGIRLFGHALPKSGEELSGAGQVPVEWSDDAEWTGGWALVSGVSVGLGF